MKFFEFEKPTILVFLHTQFCINEITCVKTDNFLREFYQVFFFHFIGYKRPCYRPIVIAPTNIALETIKMSHESAF